MEAVCLPAIAENLMTVSALIHAIQDQIVTLVRYNSAMYSYSLNIMGIFHALVIMQLCVPVAQVLVFVLLLRPVSAFLAILEPTAVKVWLLTLLLCQS